ncbi:transketolase-like TK C-terminal-containing protein, partial [Anaerotalea alkaliphila]|nr:transketolase [Anaerotalea alkaliphila]
GVRVVSMPSMDLFEKQPESYREAVLPVAMGKRLVVEAGTSQGWDKHLGNGGTMVAMEGFGASGPAQELFEAYGFTVDNLVARAKAIL